GQNRARRRPHAGSRRKAVLLLLSQPARVDQQYQEPQNRNLGLGTLYELSHGDAWTDAVGARTGQGELRDLPRSTRFVERPDAGGPDADAVSTLPRRDEAS